MVLSVVCVQLVLLGALLRQPLSGWKASLSIELMRLPWPLPVPPQQVAHHGADAS